MCSSVVHLYFCRYCTTNITFLLIITGLESCDPKRPSWNTVPTLEHVYLVGACSLTMGVFTVVETTTHKWLHVFVSSDTTYPIVVGMDAASVVVYSANHTGFPVNGSLPVVSASFNQKGKSEVVEGNTSTKRVFDQCTVYM